MTHHIQRFHRVYGVNVAMEGDRVLARWVPKQSGGSMFSEEPLLPGEIVHIEVKGSGHVELGIIRQCAQNLGKDVFFPTRDLSDFKMLNEIRLHKRDCKIRVSLDENGRKVSSSYNDKSFVQDLDDGRQVWLAADVRFGDIDFRFIKNDQTNRTSTFSTTHGPNIYLSDLNTTASTTVVNPGAICFKESPLRQGEQLQIECNPIIEGAASKPPSRYHLSLCVSSEDPSNLHSRCETNFTLQSGKMLDLNIIEIEKLVKEDCKGIIYVQLGADKVFSYTSASGKRNKQKLDVLPSGDMWLVFKLYRVQVKISEYSEDVPDAAPMETNGDYLTPIPVKAPAKRSESEPYMEVRGEQGPSSSTEATSPKSLYPSSTPRFGLGSSIEQPQSSSQGAESQGGHQSTPESSSISTQYNDDSVELGEVMRKSWTDLVNKLTPDIFLDYLYQHKVISWNDMERIRNTAKTSRVDANRDVLSIVQRKPISRNVLIQALKESSQDHLIEYFFPKR